MKRRSLLTRYGLAIAVTVAVAAVQALAWPWLEATPYLFFFCAVLLSSWFGGWGPGLLSTALSLFAVGTLFIRSIGMQGVQPQHVVPVILFTALSLLVTWLSTLWRRGHERLRSSEARLKAMLETAVDAIITIDERGTMQTVNPATTRLFGYQPEELIGRNVSMLMPEPYRSHHDGYLHNYLRTGQRKIIGIGREVTGQRKDGSTFPMELAVSETLLPEGRLFTGIVRDVTARKQTEEELQRSALFREQFIGILGHDLRGPLSAVKVSASTLMRGELSDLQLRAIQRITSSTDRMTRMIEEILDFARGRLGGGIPVERRDSDLCQITRAAVDELSAAHPGRRVEFSSEGSCLSYCDPERIAQVVSNLVGNALTHGSEVAPVRVTVKDADGAVLLQVHNQGAPIPEESLPGLFEPFRRGKREASRNGGLGLGLYIVSEIVKSHEGRIEVGSSAEHGTHFTVRLPACSVTPPR